MRGAKIFVLQVKDIIRTGIFVLIGLLLIILLVMALLPKKEASAQAVYAPGTYTAQIILHNKPVNIEVTVSEHDIMGIALTGMEESQELFYPLFKPTMSHLSKEVVKQQTTNIPTTADSAVTSNILLRAIRAALAQAMAVN